MSGRIVAELGRPETPQETADRKAASSKAYRSSQNFRSLIGAIIATLAILAIVILIVPRGDIDAGPTKSAADAVATAEKLSEQVNGPVYAVTTIPDDWQVNGAPARKEVDGSYVWQVVYAPNKDSKEVGFVTLEQAFGEDSRRAGVKLGGSREDGVVTIDGTDWTRFALTDSMKSQRVTYALGTQVGSDYVLLYGNASEDRIRGYAANLTAQFSDAKEDSP